MKIRVPVPPIVLEAPQEISVEPELVQLTPVMVKVLLAPTVIVPPTVKLLVFKVVLSLKVRLLMVAEPPTRSLPEPDIVRVVEPALIVLFKVTLPAAVMLSFQVVATVPEKVKLLNVLPLVVNALEAPFMTTVPEL